MLNQTFYVSDLKIIGQNSIESSADSSINDTEIGNVYR